MSMTYRKFINKYLELPEYEIKKAQKDGESDGRKNIPKPDENEFSGVVLKILTEARSSWTTYLSAKKVYLKEIKNKLSEADYEIDTNISASIQKENATLEQEQSLYIILFDKKGNKIQNIEKINLNKRLRHYGSKVNGDIFFDDNAFFVSTDDLTIMKINFLNFR